jgi:Leu/Phe-tRNA-protein transferase
MSKSKRTAQRQIRVETEFRDHVAACADAASPPPFRRRNIFIDSTVGDRV